MKETKETSTRITGGIVFETRRVDDFGDRYELEVLNARRGSIMSVVLTVEETHELVQNLLDQAEDVMRLAAMKEKS